MGPVNIVTALHRIAKQDDAQEALDDPFFKVLSASMLSVVQDGAADPRGLANTSWAFASLLVMDSPLLTAISRAALTKCSEFHGQSISNTAWSMARLCLADGPLRAAIAQQAIRRISDLDSQDLSNTAWSFAPLALSHIPLMDAIASASMPQISNFTP